MHPYIHSLSISIKSSCTFRKLHYVAIYKQRVGYCICYSLDSTLELLCNIEWMNWLRTKRRKREREREKLEEPNKRMNRCNSTRVCFLSSPIFLSPFFLIVNLIRFLTSLVLSIPISLDSDAICCCSPHSSNANRCLTLTTIHNWIETCSVHRATNINICIMHKLCCCCWFCCFQLLFMPFCE